MKNKNSDKMIEISRKIIANYGKEIEYSSIDCLDIDAEIGVLDEDNEVYLHVEWSSEFPDEFYMEVTRKSIIEVLDKLNKCSDDERGELMEEYERIQNMNADDAFLKSLGEWERYGALFDEIIEMIKKEVEERKEYDDVPKESLKRWERCIE